MSVVRSAGVRLDGSYLEMPQLAHEPLGPKGRPPKAADGGVVPLLAALGRDGKVFVPEGQAGIDPVGCLHHALLQRARQRVTHVDHHAVWLDPEIGDAEQLTPLLGPFPAAGMEGYPVSTYVNSPGNDSPRCIEPLAE